jgi:hypothetical protein
MNCPKCDADIGDSYEPDDRSVGICGGWYCDVCDLAIGEHEVPREPMAAKINEDRNGRRAQAGQAVRLLDIPADANKEGAEVREAISRVRLFIETHGDSRFEPVDKSENFRPMMNRAGWRKGEGSERIWLVPAETWKTQICSGLDAGLVARVLADRGMLERGNDGLQRVH